MPQQCHQFGGGGWTGPGVGSGVGVQRDLEPIDLPRLPLSEAGAHSVTDGRSHRNDSIIR